LKPSIVSASFAGIGLGIALLTKLTWVTGFLSLPLAIVLSCLFFHRQQQIRSLYHRALDGCLFVVIALLVLNAGYLFEGFGKKLGEYEFCSEMLGGPGTSSKNTGNRFEESWLKQVPVPVPKNFLLGIDFLRQEVEEKKWSFLLGEWKQGSWPHYYVVTTLLKTPEGMLIGAFLGGICWLVLLVRQRLSIRVGSMMFMLVVPAVAVFLSVSLQGGFNHHHRYVLNIYPPMYVLAAFLVSDPISQFLADRFAPIYRQCILMIGIALCALSAGSSLCTTPHFLSYFNLISGGSQNGWRMLGYSNVDWGQDLLLVHDWIEAHRECKPICVECVNGQIAFTTADWGSVPQVPEGASWRHLQRDQDQWYVICVNRLNHPPASRSWSYLKELKPVDRIGFSHHVYFIPARKE